MDDKSTAQTKVQIQIVEQLEQQLQKVRKNKDISLTNKDIYVTNKDIHIFSVTTAAKDEQTKIYI